MAKKTTNKIAKAVTAMALAILPVTGGVFAAGLVIRYFGDKPVLKDVAKGLKGDVVGLFV